MSNYIEYEAEEPIYIELKRMNRIGRMAGEFILARHINNTTLYYSNNAWVDDLCYASSYESFAMIQKIKLDITDTTYIGVVTIDGDIKWID